MSLRGVVGVATNFQFLVTQADGVTPYTGLVNGDFTKSFYNDGSSVAITGTVTEIGSGVYYLTFTPDAEGVWLAQAYLAVTRDYIGEYFQVETEGIPGEVAEAQLNVVYDPATPLLGMMVSLDRDGRSIAKANLTSCEVKFYSQAGALLFTETSNTPIDPGHFRLTNGITIGENQQYNAEVTVVDDVSSVTTYQQITAAG